MGNFSKDPFEELRRSREQGYVGVHVEQGVPVLDRDLNLLADLVAGTLRELVARHLGSGVAARDEAFAVAPLPADNDLRIDAPPGGGACLVGGIEATIRAPLAYGDQSGMPALTTPADRDRDDVVYLDVWVEEVDSTADATLANDADVAVQTSVRLRPAWRVCVAEDARAAPAPAAGHAHCPLARLERPRGEAAIREEMIVDLRRTGLNLADLVRRVEQLEAALGERPLQPARPELLVVNGAAGPRGAGEPPGALELIRSREEQPT